MIMKLKNIEVIYGPKDLEISHIHTQMSIKQKDY